MTELTKEEIGNVELLQGKHFHSTISRPVKNINNAHKSRQGCFDGPDEEVQRYKWIICLEISREPFQLNS